MGKRSKRDVCIKYPAEGGIDACEDALRSIGSDLPSRSTIDIDLRQLSFAPLDMLVSSVFFFNELARRKNEVVLRWDQDQPAYSYADRMGFFKLLDPASKSNRPGRRLATRSTTSTKKTTPS